MHKKLRILLMTHGELGKALIETAAMFWPLDASLLFLGLHEEQTIGELQEQLNELLDKEQEFLILTDMVAAATTRVAAHALLQGNVEVISGVNLVMLITALREKDKLELPQLSELVRKAAKDDIVDIRTRLKEEKQEIRKERGTCTKC